MSTQAAQGKKYGKVEATLEAQPIGYGRFAFVKLQPRLTNSSGQPNQAANVLYGDATDQTFELVSGQFSEWLPVSDLRDIYVRVLPGGIDNTCTVAWVGSDRAT
jgi:hypothetical protein